MKAPDKVFFPNDINLLTKLSLVIKQKGDVCYIRKGLVDEMVKSAEDHAYFAGRERFREEMLEWAKEEIGNTSILRSETIETLQKVIDKLNSM